MPAAKRRSYFSLQVGRGLAALLVVFHHAAKFAGDDARYWHHTWLQRRFYGTALGVEYFFVLSGAVLLLAHRKDFSRPATLASYAWKRFRRIYPIYWCVLTLVVLNYALRPGLGDRFQTSPWVIGSGYLLVHIHSLQNNLPVAWTLFHEVLFYAVFAFLLWSRRVGSVVLGLWCLLSVVMCFHPGTPFYSTYLFSPLHLLFPLGMLVTWLLNERRIPVPAVVAGLGLVLFGWEVVRGGLLGISSMSDQLLAGLGAMLVILGLAALEDLGKLRLWKPLGFLGDASYSVYLAHYPFLMFAAPVLFKLWKRHAAPVTVPFLLMVLLGTAAGCLLHVWVELPMLRWMQKPSTAPLRS
jgi:peptidoglycan/LPS O-acetylase OafA/YrhL